MNNIAEHCGTRMILTDWYVCLNCGRIENMKPYDIIVCCPDCGCVKYKDIAIKHEHRHTTTSTQQR